MLTHPSAAKARLVAASSVVAIVVAACGGSGGGGSTNTTPTAPSTPVTPVATNTWSVAGQVVATGTQVGIGGASLTPGWSLAAVTADGQGAYELGDKSNPPSTPYPVGLAAPGFLSHDVWITWQRGPRLNVMLDMIRDAAPFSRDFYGQLVRGKYDQPGAPWPVLRLDTAPSFYVKTADQNGRPVEPEVLASVLDALQRAVPAWSGGRLSAARIETGTDSRPAVTDWINVDIRRDPKENRICGFANIGANPGSITLNDDVCSCGSNKIPGAVTMHEVGHAMGFFHVGDRKSLMFPFIAGDCPAGALSAAELYHAGIAYARPRGNVEPDSDPPSNAPLSAIAPVLRVR